MICVIYKIVNDINDKVYVGQTWQPLQERFWQHCKPSQSACRKLHRAISKYGSSHFTIVPLLICHAQDVADHWEIFFIRKLDTIEHGYNIKEGGSAGKHSEETKRKISKANRGKPSPRKGVTLSEETKNKIRLANTGYRHSDSTKKKISKANRGRKSPRKGKSVSIDTKRKCLENSSNRKLTADDVRIVIDMWSSGDYKQREIADIFGVTQTAISRVVNKKTYILE